MPKMQFCNAWYESFVNSSINCWYLHCKQDVLVFLPICSKLTYFDLCCFGLIRIDMNKLRCFIFLWLDIARPSKLTVLVSPLHTREFSTLDQRNICRNDSNLVKEHNCIQTKECMNTYCIEVLFCDFLDKLLVSPLQTRHFGIFACLSKLDLCLLVLFWFHQIRHF